MSNINNSLKNLSKNFTNNIINNIKNNINNNNSNDDDVFNHPYVLLFIGVAALGMIYYVFSRYYTSGRIKKSYTFYGKDIQDKPVFKDNFDTAPECVNRCKRDFYCDGITFNRSTGDCTGIKNGRLREDDANYRAWVKTRIEDKAIFEKAKVSDYISEETRIAGVKFPLPQGVNNFSILFWINLKDWYENFGFWKHILHKGSPMEGRTNYTNWEDIIRVYPDQCPGLWLSPYTNNLRIAITTFATETINDFPSEHPNTGSCIGRSCFTKHQSNTKLTTSSTGYQSYTDPRNRNIEFHDIKNVPISNIVFLGLVFNDHIIEVFINGRLTETIHLSGSPVFSRGDFYAKYEKTFRGDLYKVYYFPKNLKANEIRKLFKDKPKLV